MNSWWSEFVLGFAVVVLVTARRFDIPFPVREYTTAARYYTGQAGYVATSVFAYCLLYLLLVTYHASDPVLFALTLTVVSAYLPFLRKIDARIRNFFQSSAGVPSEARRLALTLTFDRFHPSEELSKEVKSVLLLRGFDVDDDWLPAAKTVRRLWVHSAMCFYLVRGWENNPRYRHFAASCKQDFDILRQRFDQLSCQVVRVLNTIERLAELWSEDEAKNENLEDKGVCATQRANKQRIIVNELITDLREDITFFHENLSLFIARGVLAQSLTERSRRQRLMQLGFEVNPENSSIPAVLFLVFVFYVLVFIAFLVLPSGSIITTQRLERAVIIAATQAISVAVAVIPKRLFAFANEDLYGKTPWHFVLGAGLLAVVLAFSIHWLFLLPLTGGQLHRSSLWLLTSFCTAATIAYLVQDSRWSNLESITRRRFYDIAVMCTGIGASVGGVRMLQYLLFDRIWELQRFTLDLGLVITIGFFIGATVPSAFRNPVPTGSNRPISQTSREKQPEKVRRDSAIGLTR